MQIILNLLRTYEPIVVIALLAIMIVLFIWIIFLHLNLKAMRQKSTEFFAGNNVKNIEDIIIGHSKAIKTLDKDIQELYNISNQINILSQKGLHKFGMIRFNPFKDVGGDQSFAIAMLNGKNNGLVISSLYTREGTRVYAKAILGGESEKYQLTEEEDQVIKIANSSSTNKKI
ncbi:MAG: hypothetical protein COX30_04420 [Candidatus Moranbacteria bacterium CG23_combo_of_CG06-09_8_20_14_all_39_10]|nr:MAG: hypothetical protein COX30_04420 [Candidatus Moranbacteria bacterium CG23_combo_of_CG06-09_8_20_14_all_39_10]